MKAAKKDTSGLFQNVLVHFGEGKAQFHKDHLKINRSIVTLPSAWYIKPFTEVNFQIELPKKGKKAASLIDCHGIIVNCQPLKKKKGHYKVELFVSDLPTEHEVLFQ